MLFFFFFCQLLFLYSSFFFLFLQPCHCMFEVAPHLNKADTYLDFYFFKSMCKKNSLTSLELKASSKQHQIDGQKKNQFNNVGMKATVTLQVPLAGREKGNKFQTQTGSPDCFFSTLLVQVRSAEHAWKSNLLGGSLNQSGAVNFFHTRGAEMREN